MVMPTILRRCVKNGLVQAEEGELMERAWTEVKERFRVNMMDEKLKQDSDPKLHNSTGKDYMHVLFGKSWFDSVFTILLLQRKL